MKLFKRVAYCTDFSEGADRAFDVAAELARSNGARLYFVHVIPPIVAPSPAFEEFVPSYTSVEITEEVMKASQEKISEWYVPRLQDYPNYEVRIENGYPSNRIVEFAEKNQVDLIVMGSQGLTGLAHVFFGSTAEKVVRKADCSVLCVRRQPEKDPS